MSVIPAVSGALSGLKTASELATRLREALGRGDVKLDEVLARIIELQGFISDGRAALIDVQEEVHTKNEEIRSLNQQLRSIADKAELSKDLIFDGAVYWRKSEGPDAKSPFCAVCWDTDQKLVRCQNYGTDTYDSGVMTKYFCVVHTKSFHSSTVRYK
jgi:hypothetical protein